MKDLLAIYILLPIVYAMYKSGELAVEKGRNPVMWRTCAFLISFTAGCLSGGLTGLTIYVTNKAYETSALVGWPAAVFFLCSLGAGFILISHLRKKKPIPQAKRRYRIFDLKNAMLFPRMIPRGGFLWRAVAYFILLHLGIGLVFLPLIIGLALAGSSWIASISILVITLYILVGIMCLGILYYISHICIPRIRDAGLSRDTLILLFIPGLNTVAALMLLFTPTSRSGRATI